MWSRLQNPKLSFKIALLGVLSAIVTAATLVGLAVWQSGQYNSLAQNEVDQLIDSDLDHIAQGIYNLVQTANETAQQRVDANLRVARHVLENTGAVSQSQETIAWTCINQLTGDSVSVRLPKLLVGGRWLGRNGDTSATSPIVDETTRLVGETATIFQIMNQRGDMLRVATTVTNQNGTRAIGTYIPAVNPDGTPNRVIRSILNGKTYHGLAFVVDAWYLTAYESIKDREGNLVGMLYVGVKQESVAAPVREAIISTSVGVTGYVYVLGGKGRQRGHYIISQNGERDGEDIWENQDSDNRFVIQEIVKKAVNLRSGEFATEMYRWQNPGEAAPRWKIARLAYFEPWDWVIGTSVYLDELERYKTVLSSGRLRMTTTMVIAGVISMFVIGALGALLAWTIIRPVRQMTAAVETIVQGNLDHTVEIRTRDEIGGLARAFNIMTDRLKHTIEGLHRSEEKYRSIYSNALEGIFQTSFEGRFLSANPSMARMLGYDSPEELIACIDDVRTQVYVQPEDRETFVSVLREKGIVLGHEIEVRLKNGGTTWIAMSAHAVRNEAGAPIYIEGFVTDNSERRRAQEQLVTSLKEKELLLREIHHRVKNNMQVITSLLNLQAMSLTDEKMKDVFMDSQNRIRSMALIHELLYYSGIYGSIDFKEYCNTLVRRLQTIYNGRNVEMGVDGDNLTLSLDQAIPCGLILNELVSNALKHAFPAGERGRVSIQISVKNQNCHLTVSDDGRGMPATTDEKQTTSIGMQLLRSLAQQVEGTLEIKSDHGVTSVLTFPIIHR